MGFQLLKDTMPKEIDPVPTTTGRYYCTMQSLVTYDNLYVSLVTY